VGFASVKPRNVVVVVALPEAVPGNEIASCSSQLLTVVCWFGVRNCCPTRPRARNFASKIYFSNCCDSLPLQMPRSASAAPMYSLMDTVIHCLEAHRARPGNDAGREQFCLKCAPCLV
jgi:hypothetical protein